MKPPFPPRPAHPRHLWQACALVALGLAALPALAQGASADTPASATPMTAQKAREQLQADQALCDKEATPRGRLSCRRDAMQAYEEALDHAGAGRSPAPQAQAASPAAAAIEPVAGCPACGRVTVSRQVEAPSDLGAGSAPLGGRFIEQRLRNHKPWMVEVRYPAGEVVRYLFPQDPGFKPGEAVRKAGQGIEKA